MLEYGRHWRGILFRRSYPELEELIQRSSAMYPIMFPGASFNQSKKQWTFPNGATLKLRFLESSASAVSYQGHQYTWIGFDELPTHRDPYGYLALKACLRSAHGVKRKRIRATGNPGGPGHNWVKERFIDPSDPNVPFFDQDTGQRIMFIPSRVQDNKILLENDPDYINILKGLGSKELVKAWLEGDWNVVLGAYFDDWSLATHVIDPFKIPHTWQRFRAFDWGSASPFSVGWYAISDGSKRGIQKGAIVRYREWYGCTEPNVGLRLTVEKVAEGIKSREAFEEIAFGVADPAIFSEDGGPSMARRMARAHDVKWSRADNKRIPGWQQVKARLVGNAEGPMLFVFKTCYHLIRTLPILQHDEHNIEDLDTRSEDHAADELRYACMSRKVLMDGVSYTNLTNERKSVNNVNGFFPRNQTINELWEEGERMKSIGNWRI